MNRYLFASLLLFVSAVQCEEVILAKSTGSVNWTTGIVKASGEAYIPESLLNNPSAKRAVTNKARLMAYRNLAEIVAGIQVTSTTTVENMMLQHDIVTSKVDALIRGAEVAEVKEEDDKITVTLTFNTERGLVTALAPLALSASVAKPKQADYSFWSDAWNKLNSYHFFPSAHAGELNSSPEITSPEELIYAKKLYHWLLEKDQVLAMALAKHIEQYEERSVFTGVLIDASDVIDFTLAVIPVIRNERGEKIYPGQLLSFDDGRSSRPVSYDFSISDATKNRRVANKPLIIKAISIYNKLKSDLVISNESARLLTSNKHISEAIKHASVMIVVNK